VQKLYKDTIPLVKRLIVNLINIDTLEDIDRINKEREIEVKNKGDKELSKQAIYVTGLTRSHVPARFDVLNPCSRSSQDTYARSPYNSYLYPYLAHKDSSSSSKCLCINTHSYAYVAFFNYYPV